LPVLIEENVGPVEAISRSLDLLKRNWGENLLGNGGISLGIAVIAIPIVVVAVLIMFAAIATKAAGSMILGMLFFALTVIVLGLVSTTLHTIYTAALYRFATGSKDNAGIDGDLLAAAYRQK
jgi:predicted membrane channel-forming protein YqfA (hemolysin III family)